MIILLKTDFNEGCFLYELPIHSPKLLKLYCARKQCIFLLNSSLNNQRTLFFMLCSKLNRYELGKLYPLSFLQAQPTFRSVMDISLIVFIPSFSFPSLPPLPPPPFLSFLFHLGHKLSVKPQSRSYQEQTKIQIFENLRSRIMLLLFYLFSF